MHQPAAIALSWDEYVLAEFASSSTVDEKGDIAVATARNPSQLSFLGTNEMNFLALELDVTSKDSIDKAFENAVAKFGRVDVV